jgi:putative NADH-flavin reductase
VRLAVFGGTGRTGRLLVARALDAGHEVRALARRPATLDETRGERLAVVAGDVRDAEAVSETIAGAEAVLSALGPVADSDADLLSAAARDIGAAAREHGARRLVWLTGAGVRDAGDRPKLVDRAFGAALRLVQRRLLEDSTAAVEAIRASDLEWTIVRAPRLVDGPGGGPLYIGPVGPGSGTKVARADVAAFMLGEALEPAHARAMPVVSTA